MSIAICVHLDKAPDANGSKDNCWTLEHACSFANNDLMEGSFLMLWRDGDQVLVTIQLQRILHANSCV